MFPFIEPPGADRVLCSVGAGRGNHPAVRFATVATTSTKVAVSLPELASTLAKECGYVLHASDPLSVQVRSLRRKHYTEHVSIRLSAVPFPVRAIRHESQDSSEWLPILVRARKLLRPPDPVDGTSADEVDAKTLH